MMNAVKFTQQRRTRATKMKVGAREKIENQWRISHKCAKFAFLHIYPQLHSANDISDCCF